MLCAYFTYAIINSFIPPVRAIMFVTMQTLNEIFSTHRDTGAGRGQTPFLAPCIFPLLAALAEANLSKLLTLRINLQGVTPPILFIVPQIVQLVEEKYALTVLTNQTCHSQMHSNTLATHNSHFFFFTFLYPSPRFY